MPSSGAPIPVTIIAGFLGAGKTTLINRILHGETGLRIAAMVNDFGELNIDASLLGDRSSGVVSLSNGCICCSLQGELADEIDQLLLTQNGKIDHILIECSGLSDPMRIADILRYPGFRGRVRLNTIVAVLDAANITKLGDVEAELARAQLGGADIVLVNKTDLVEKKDIAIVETDWILQDTARIATIQGNAPVHLILDSGTPQQENNKPCPENSNHSEQFSTWVWSSEDLVDLNLLRSVLKSFAPQLLRAKGIVQAYPNGQHILLQMVGSRIDLSPVGSTIGDPSSSDIVIIMSVRSGLSREQVNGSLNQARAVSGETNV